MPFAALVLTKGAGNPNADEDWTKQNRATMRCSIAIVWKSFLSGLDAMAMVVEYCCDIMLRDTRAAACNQQYPTTSSSKFYNLQ
mmetsp:Transcript_1351/g.2929  ORF Transcript_1351/g.2929 Transcript_1351/m.2929 type:complete len:84 (+) Transcript_1351:1279-1530(+)